MTQDPPNGRRKDSRRNPLFSFVGVSLLLHLQLILLAVAVLSMNPDGCSSQADLPLGPVEVSLVDDAAKVQRSELVQKAIERDKKEEERKERDAKGQVVELPRPLEEHRPDHAKYLSEYDSTVDKQSKAKPSALPPGRRARQLRPPSPQVAPPRPPTKPAPNQGEQEPNKLAMRARPEPDMPRSSLPSADQGEKTHRPGRTTRSQQPRVEPVPVPQLPGGALRLSDRELAEALGGMVNDALQDVEEGEETLLNSKRWLFASFFNRVKRQVAQNWHPDMAYRRRDPSGNVYGFKDRLTILRVRLTPRGELKGMHLEQPSGLGFLDDEAMNAFRLAEPFPNPPKGLVDGRTGLISFRFGFLFELSRRSNFRIMRFQN